MSKIALGTYEITKPALGHAFATHSYLDYIDTAISYNNDVILGDGLSQYWKDAKIISKMAPQMSALNYDLFMDNHLHNLKRDYIDIMLVHNNRCDKKVWIEQIKKFKSDNRILEYGVSNFTIENLKDYHKEFGEYPKYLEIELNPLYTDLDLVEFCKSNGIKVIAYCILGGKYNAVKMISNFTLEYLISRASKLADIIIIRSDNQFHLYEMIQCARSSNEVEDLHVNSNKVIVPDSYNSPIYFRFNKTTGVINQYCKTTVLGMNYTYFTNEQCLEYINNSELVELSDDFIKELKSLEFVTDARVHLFNSIPKLFGINTRYWNQFESVYDSIVCEKDEKFILTLYSVVNGKMSKIITKDCKLYLVRSFIHE